MRRTLALGLIAAALPTTYALARSIRHDVVVAPTFELAGRPIGGAKPATPTAAHLTGSRIAAIGEGALVIDADSGALIATDRDGKLVAQLAIGRDAGLLAYDAAAGLAYVADRHGDKIEVIKVIKVGARLERAKTFKTPAEPYGVALSPDRQTLLVSTIADRTLVAYDTATGTERWRTGLAREPRGLAIAPDGTRALVSYLVTGTVDQIDLRDGGRGNARRAEHIALSTTAPPRRCRGCSTSDGDGFARAAFAVTFMGEHQAVVPFQREVPIQQRSGATRPGSYGGGFEPPVTQHLAFLGLTATTPVQVTAETSLHQPRALAWDGVHDALYVVGLGSDTILQVRNASQRGIAQGGLASFMHGKKRCGPDGVAITPGQVLVWCSFTRSVARLPLDAHGQLTSAIEVRHGAPLVATRWTEAQHAGLVLFHSADPATSQRGSMACSTCHPDNRADGLSWRIDQHELQTPVLAGRVVGTHPFKWDGGDADLEASLTNTMKRLGGFGLDKRQTAALSAYVETLPAVRSPTREAGTVARGKQLFDSAELGCRTCHDGASYTDQARHKFTGTLAESDTPSLLGLAASAPYFHDGSAPTLEAVLRDRGAVHGMGDASKLTDPQVADLTAFLESL